jgi:hypothetical protein
MVLLGYEEGSKAYRLYDPKRGKVVISRDVVFDEMAAWDWVQQGAGEAGGVSSTFTIEHLVMQGGGGAGVQAAAAAEEQAAAAAGEQAAAAAGEQAAAAAGEQAAAAEQTAWCIYLHHRSLRQQDRGHHHWNLLLHPPTSTSMWMLSMTVRRRGQYCR